MGKLSNLALEAAPQFKTLIPSKGTMANMRSFLVKEQKLLLIAKEAEGDQLKAIIGATMQLIQNCMLDNIDVKTLPVFDIEYIFVQLYMNSTATKFNHSHYRCNAPKIGEDGLEVRDDNGEPVPCGGISKVKIDLSKARVNTSEIKTGVIDVNSKTIDKLVFVYPTFDQVMRYEQAITTEDHETIYRIYAECLTTIYKKDGTELVHGEDFDTDDAIEFLEYQPGNIFDKIVDLIVNIPRVVSETDFECTKCGHKKVINLRGLEDFF